MVGTDRVAAIVLEPVQGEGGFHQAPPDLMRALRKICDANGVVLGTPERAGLRAIQTPQGFRTDVLRRAYERAGAAVGFTDDASVVEAIGTPVQVVDGDPLAFKITTPTDLLLAEALLGRAG